MAVAVWADGDRGELGLDAIEDFWEVGIGAAVVWDLEGVDVGERQWE